MKCVIASQEEVAGRGSGRLKWDDLKSDRWELRRGEESGGKLWKQEILDGKAERHFGPTDRGGKGKSIGKFTGHNLHHSQFSSSCSSPSFHYFSRSSLTAFPDSQMFLARSTRRSQDKCRECLQDPKSSEASTPAPHCCLFIESLSYQRRACTF